jgi:predicted amidohydrolase YtcJ
MNNVAANAWRKLTVALASTLINVSAFAVPNMIVHNAKITTFDGNTFSGFAVEDGRFTELSKSNSSLLAQADSDTVVIDAKGQRVIPGINDSHLHVVRGGRFYNLETRWEGLTSLKKGIEMIAEQAKRTPEGHWVRVVGGWSPYQFDEKRMPTPQELTEAAPNTPVFALHLYSGGVLNKKAMEVMGINKDSVPPKGRRYERHSDGNPTRVLIADPNPMILYGTIAALPHMTLDEQYNSSKQYYRKLLSLGVTSVNDAGGGGHTFPVNYQASTVLAARGELPIRVSNYLFPQKPGEELNSFAKWMSNYKSNQNLHIHMDNGYVIEGGGELLAWKASDYENFRAARPELHKDAEKELEKVVRLHLLQGWPFRIHATYNESIERMLAVFEMINRTQPMNSVRWIIDHAETVTDENLDRIKALGGAIAVQGRMAFAGEDFLERYGAEQTKRTPPIKVMLDKGIPVGMGTDGTRVSSFNPWATYYWLVSGRTVGHKKLYDDSNRLDRLTALRLFTHGSAYISGDQSVKGQIKEGQYADFAILNHDIMSVKEKALLNTESMVTVVDGKVRFADKEMYPALHIPKEPATPAWSPVNFDSSR